MGRVAQRVACAVLGLTFAPVAVAASASGLPPRGASKVTLGCRDTAFGPLTAPFSSTAANVVAQTVAWPELRHYAASLPGASFTWPHRLGLAVKALAVVRSGAVVRVVVPPAERARLSLYYVAADPRRQVSVGSLYRVSDGEREVTFRACAASADRSQVSEFPGYFVVRGPQCAVIDIYARAGRPPLRRQIPFGVPEAVCPAAPGAAR